MNDKKQDKKKSIIFTIIVFALIAILGFLAVFSYKVEEKNCTNSKIALNGDNLYKNENQVSIYGNPIPWFEPEYVNLSMFSREYISLTFCRG